MNTSESLNELAAALAKAQGEMESAKKGAENPFLKSHYADLASVVAAIKAPLSKNGLSYIQTPYTSDDGYIGVTTRLMHSSGQWIEGELALPVSKKDSQGVGSALTYARRYGLQAICGIPSEDDDGEAAKIEPEKVSSGQAAELEQLIQQLDDPKKFMKYAGIKSIVDMAASDYEKYSLMLTRKITSQEAAKDAKPAA